MGRSILFTLVGLAGCTFIGAKDVAEFYDRDGDGFRWDEDDCDDAVAEVSPVAVEACNGVDDDCDAETDEAGSVGEAVFYADTDVDGFGALASTVSACATPPGYVSDSLDCDDAKSDIHPGATEICDGVDNDCDAVTDPATASGAPTFYEDTDDDGYGDVARPQLACVAPSGFVSDDTDCDDRDANVNPGGVEVCDGVDDDCDGIDDPTSAVGWVAADGARSDVTTTWSVGKPASPGAITMDEDGVLSFCGGRWYATVEVGAADVSIVGYDATIDANLTGPVLSVVNGAAVLAITGMSLVNGLGSDYDYDVTEGSCLTTHDGGAGATVTLVDVVLSSTSAGGNLIYASGGVVSLTDTIADGGRRSGARFDDCDLTISGGSMSRSQVSGLTVVGGVAEIDGVTFASNTEHGVSLERCDARLANVVITGTSTWDSLGAGSVSTVRVENSKIADNPAGAFYVNKSTVTVVDTEVSGNGRGQDGAAFRGIGGGSFELIDVQVFDNVGGKGVVAMSGFDSMSCAVDDGSAGFWGNTATSGGAIWTDGRPFEASGCDFGTGADDNSPADVYVSLGDTATFDYGAGATFSCGGTVPYCK